MSSEKLIEDWNTMFTSFKISSHDLDSPTEAFITNALVNILNSINVAIGPRTDLDPESQRVAKIKLFQYVNYMYRTLNKKKFLFFDLINPNPKKTLNLLQTLLNYVLYYNMVKDEVVGATKTSMIKFREMTEKKQQCIKDNEHNKNMAKQMQVAMESYAKEVIKMTKLVDEQLFSPILAQYEKNLELKTNLQMMQGQLNVDINELQVQCVQEDEYKRMQSSVFEAQECLSEVNELAEKLAEDHKSLSEDMVYMEERISTLEYLNGMVYAGKIVTASEIIDLQEELMQQSSEVEENGHIINTIKEQLDACQQKLNEIQIERNAARDTFNTHWGPILSCIEEKECTQVVWQEYVQEASTAAEFAEWELDQIAENSILALDIVKKSNFEDPTDDL